MTFHNLQSHMARRYAKMYLFIRHTFCESLVMICVTKRKRRSFIWYFLEIRLCFHPYARENSPANQKSGNVRIISNKIHYFSVRYRRLRQTEYQHYQQKDFPYVWMTCACISSFRSRTFLQYPGMFSYFHYGLQTQKDLKHCLNIVSSLFHFFSYVYLIYYDII